MSNTCNHQKYEYRTYTRDFWCTFVEDHIEEVVTELELVSALEDIDTHRMRCSKCGKIEYYSKSARDHYEHGIPSPWVVK